MLRRPDVQSVEHCVMGTVRGVHHCLYITGLFLLPLPLLYVHALCSPLPMLRVAILTGHQMAVTSVDWKQIGDRSVIATCSDDRVGVCQVTRGNQGAWQLVHHETQSHTGRVPDGVAVSHYRCPDMSLCTHWPTF